MTIHNFRSNFEIPIVEQGKSRTLFEIIKIHQMKFVFSLFAAFVLLAQAQDPPVATTPTAPKVTTPTAPTVNIPTAPTITNPTAPSAAYLYIDISPCSLFDRLKKYSRSATRRCVKCIDCRTKEFINLTCDKCSEVSKHGL
jgi:hypothetical protein